MAFNPRNVFLFGILVTAALLTSIFAMVVEETDVESAERTFEPRRYYLERAVRYRTDAEGRVSYRIRADHIDQQDEGENFLLNQMSVEYAPDSGILWNIAAGSGLAIADRDFLDLSEGVRLAYAPDTNQEALVLETDELSLYADDLRAVTDSSVTLRRDSSEMTALGMDLDLEANAWTLGLTTMIAFSVIAAPAEAQDNETEKIEIACESSSGSALSNERICVGFEFSDGINTVSAGLAKSNKFDFESSVWSLSEGVRFGFGTTEIVANEAIIEFEADEPVFGQLQGDPVEMSDYIQEREIAVRGTAQTIAYDKRNGTLRLAGSAEFVVGDNEFVGCDWVYNFLDKTYDAGSRDDCNIVVRVATPEEEDDDASDSQPASP